MQNLYPCLLLVQVSSGISFSLFAGFPAEPGNLKKPGDLNFICPGPDIAWNLSQKVRKPGQNKKFTRKPG